MNRARRILRSSALFALVTLGPAASANEVVTSFEFSDSTGQFVLGQTPRFTAFNGGSAQPAIPALVHSGSSSWLIGPGFTIGEIETFPSQHVEFYFKDENMDVESEVRLFDVSGMFVARFKGNPSSWTHVVAGSSTVRIARITILHGGSGLVAIDDFSTCGIQSVGTNYCATFPDCDGLLPLMGAFGSASVAANDLTLFAGPATNPGVFRYGLNQVQNPFGANFICVNGPGDRIGVTFAAGNYLVLNVDLNSPAFAAFPITPGSTWNFQGWHRNHCGTGATLTDGLEITFAP